LYFTENTQPLTKTWLYSEFWQFVEDIIRSINVAVAKSTLKFGNEVWVGEGTPFRSSTDEIFETLIGITKLDKEKKQRIREKTGAQNIVKEIKQYQKKWLQHVQRMDRNRLPRQALKYRPEGRRNIGRPKKRWRDQLHLEDQETVNTPKPSGT